MQHFDPIMASEREIGGLMDELEMNMQRSA
jgi:hypothetical protein